MAPDWAVPTDEQLDEFTKETGIEVVVNEVGWDDIREKMVTAAAGGQAVADVVEVDWSWVGEFYAADWLEPLDVSDEVKADMPTLETFTKDGKVLAIPYANDYRLSYYNTEQFEKAGITEEPQTWEDVLEACRYYHEKTGRRLTFEYSLVQGVNDNLDEAKRLTALLKDMQGHVNLIPVNPIKERDYVKSTKKVVENFKNKLEKYGINVTIRREMGADIDGACGQLRKSFIDKSNEQP